MHRPRVWSELVVLWVLLALYAVPVVWPLLAQRDLPLAGMRGLLAPAIGVPVWLVLGASTIMASVPRLRTAERLYLACGFVSATALALGFYVTSGAFMGCVVAAGALGRLARASGSVAPRAGAAQRMA